jgi:hypothetical protein
MKRFALTLALALIGALAAQANDPHEKRWQFQLGLGSPTQSAGKTFLSASPTASLLSYTLGGLKQGTWGIYTQGLMKSRSYEDSNDDDVTSSETMMGIGLQYQLRSASNPALYYGAGIGSYSLSTALSMRSGKVTTTTTTDSSDVLGGRLFIGQDFGKRYFGELSYTLMGSAKLGTSSINTSSINLGVGVRF